MGEYFSMFVCKHLFSIRGAFDMGFAAMHVE
jgi:hypothetical protein